MAGVALDVDRRRVLAYRVAAHEFDRAEGDPSRLAVVELGVQDTPYGSARVALAARTETVAGPAAAPMVIAWSTRGAPHLHRLADLPRLAEALWPLSDSDATARIANPRIKDGAQLGLAAFVATAKAFGDVVRSSMPKGQVSTAVSARVPASLSYDCGPCAARHISGALFTQAGLAGGVLVKPTGPGTVLAPIEDWPGVPSATGGTAAVIRTYLRLLGPAAPADVAKFIGTSSTELRRVWPDNLTEVRVDGRRTWLPPELVDALRAAPRPELVRLLPPLDPFLQARDRALLVPDKQRQAAVWRMIGNPGALLVDGEIAGTWRARMAAKITLEVVVTPFEPLPAATRDAVEDEAGRVATVRAARAARVTFQD